MIYLDNSATSYPKPKCVLNAIRKAYCVNAFNIGRGGYKASVRASEKVYEAREKIGEMFNCFPQNVIFTKNCTEALNLAIKGIAQKGDHFIISSLEHNSVLRVIYKLHLDDIIDFDIAKYSYDDKTMLNNFKALINSNTKAIICTHSSNAFGVTFPIEKIGRLCREKNILFIVDAAQGAGYAPIDMKKDNIDILCSAGHKGLLGPMGTGFALIPDSLELKPLTLGGTGSNSLSYSQPDFLPDRFESGTLNVPGIIGLKAGIDYLNSVGIETVYEREIELINYLYAELSGINKVKLFTDSPKSINSSPILSFNVEGYSSEAVALELAKRDICVRGGYHCSPLAHKHFNTLESGTVRVSAGSFNTKRDIDKLLKVVKKL